MSQDDKPSIPSGVPEMLTDAELAALAQLELAIQPFFAEGTALHARHTFACWIMPRGVGGMAIISNTQRGRVATCVSEYLVQQGYATTIGALRNDKPN